MDFYLRCRRLQSGAAAQADRGAMLMRSRMTRRHRHCVQARRLLFTYTMATIQPSFANAAKFFNSLLEVADILRDHGPAWREANRGHVSLDQLKVISAIERCRTVARPCRALRERRLRAHRQRPP